MNDKNILLYITGSVAAFKSTYLLRLLQKQRANIKVILTPNAEKFVSKLSLQALLKHKVYDEQSYYDNPAEITHIELAKWADFSIVAPATADFINKAANGIADNFAQTVFLATDSPKYIFPAMNDVMLNNFATQKNIAILNENKIKVFNTDFGKLAEGYDARGRMLEPEAIINNLNDELAKKNILNGVNVLITAGGTREQIDPVRFISNNSSGKMGYAIAKCAREYGANVTLVSANSNLPNPSEVKVIKVKSSADMQQVISKEMPKNKILIMAAAVSDFKPVKIAKQKIKKQDNTDQLILSLQKTDDILSNVVRDKRKDQFVIGFAAETEHPVENAKKKLQNKNLDLIVLNDVSDAKIGFDSDINQVIFIDKNGKTVKTNVETKIKVADELMKIIVHKIK